VIVWYNESHSQAFTFISDNWVIQICKLVHVIYKIFSFAVLERWLYTTVKLSAVLSI